MEELLETNKSVIKSMLFDEEKLITYVSLSKDLCIHINSSKLLLLRIVDIMRKENPDLQLNVSYIISGETQNNNAQTIVCSEQDLSKQKECFTKTFFEHIYSVRKGLCNTDTAAYLSINKFEDFLLCSGLIKSTLCDKRTSDEIGNLKTNSQEVVAPENAKPLPLKKNNQKSDTIKNGSGDINISKNNVSKSEPIIKQELISPKKETMANNKQKVTSNNNHKMQKGIAGFLNKPIKKEFSEKSKCNNATTESVKSTEKLEKIEAMDVSPEPVKVKDDSNKVSEKNKILNQIKRTSMVDKKRKRVLHVSDSDSDNENNDPFTDSIAEQDQVLSHESDDEIPPTPSANNIKIKSGFVNPKKKRKIVDKTYTDEDGYVITKKEEIYESCSDNEEEAKVEEKPPQKQVKPEISPKGKTSRPKKKVSPPQKGTQSMLTNFFKKL